LTLLLVLNADFFVLRISMKVVTTDLVNVAALHVNAIIMNCWHPWHNNAAT